MTLDIVSSHSARQSSAEHLPVPTSARWQPQRLGLVDLFYYDHEEFPFVDGRLLLRGNNGAGKSKVLALTLPFLLDGDLSPQRVEPDGDRQKRMDWNLLLGDEHPHSERLGYSWLEFGRIDDSGQPRFVTIGAGLKRMGVKDVVGAFERGRVTGRFIKVDRADLDPLGTVDLRAGKRVFAARQCPHVIPCGKRLADLRHALTARRPYDCYQWH